MLVCMYLHITIKNTLATNTKYAISCINTILFLLGLFFLIALNMSYKKLQIIPTSTNIKNIFVSSTIILSPSI